MEVLLLDEWLGCNMPFLTHAMLIVYFVLFFMISGHFYVRITHFIFIYRMRITFKDPCGIAACLEQVLAFVLKKITCISFFQRAGSLHT